MYICQPSKFQSSVWSHLHLLPTSPTFLAQGSGITCTKGKFLTPSTASPSTFCWPAAPLLWWASWSCHRLRWQHGLRPCDRLGHPGRCRCCALRQEALVLRDRRVEAPHIGAVLRQQGGFPLALRRSFQGRTRDGFRQHRRRRFGGVFGWI